MWHLKTTTAGRTPVVAKRWSWLSAPIDAAIEQTCMARVQAHSFAAILSTVGASLSGPLLELKLKVVMSPRFWQRGRRLT